MTTNCGQKQNLIHCPELSFEKMKEIMNSYVPDHWFCDTCGHKYPVDVAECYACGEPDADY